MKKLVIILSVVSLIPTYKLWASCNPDSNGGTCNVGPEVGPQGPAGPQGSPGTNGNPGSNGQDGSNGTSGATGKQGPQGPGHIDPRMNEAKLGIDMAVRLYDGKRVQLQAYNIWSPSLHDKEDALGDGRNLMFGVRVVFKLGKSYEEEVLEKQANQIKALEAALSRLQ